MRSNYFKIIGPAIVVVVICLAAYLTFGPVRGGLELDSLPLGIGSGGPGQLSSKEMQSLKTLSRTINKVQKRYIDATRINSRSMFVAAMRALQTQIAKVMVQEQGDTLSVIVETDQKTFDLSGIGTPWVLLQRIKEVYSFLTERLSSDEVDYRELEYAMINEMLQTLDPHSVFLDPNQFREMKDKTQGKFGGLGVVISIRDGFLTVISPLDGTPADRAGLLSGDQIVKIDDVSTINMPLNDAVNLLRGDPGTTVTIHILRKNWEEPLPIQIERAEVKVESTESHLLEGKVGYLQIKDFQSNTVEDMKSHLRAFERSNIKGLVIDLRGCPGGLLESAILVADHFIEKGVIVTTAGQGPTDRDIRKAVDEGDEPDYPVVVLVNRGSASASEIVAGALKNHKRALLVGERTFGKGSVQVLYDFQDGSALKLTTAQYLTPGDESIQSIGVVPHIEVLPMRADEKVVDLRVDYGYRESDLSHHFVTEPSGKDKGPALGLSYLMVPKKAPDDPKLTSELVPSDFEPDFEINLARDLILKMASGEIEGFKSDTLAKVTEQRAAAEDKKLVAALEKLDIDWTPATTQAVSQIETKANITGDKSLVAGDQAEITVSVTNVGTAPIHRLLAVSKSDFRPLDDRELAFGMLDPGQTITRTLAFRVPKDTLTRTDDVLWTFDTDKKESLGTTIVRTEIEELPTPRFAYGYQIVDTARGNGDSRLQPGESVDFVVDMENVGEGPSLETYITLAGLSGSDLSIVRGRESLKKVDPHERRRAVLSFELKPGFSGGAVEVQLSLADVDLKIYAIQKITVPVEPPLKIEVEDRTVTVAGAQGDVKVYAGPGVESQEIARFASGSIVNLEASSGDFYRIKLDDNRVGWLKKSTVSGEATGEHAVAALALRSAPKLSIDKTPQVVRTGTIKLNGKATDESSVRDVYIFVGNDKVFFKPGNRTSAQSELPFEAEVPLKNGLNYISVVAEESANLYTRETIAIRRDREDGVSYLMPKAFDEEPKPITQSR